MRSLVLVLATFVLVVYVVIGGIVFHYLESSNEEQVKVYARDIRLKFLENYTCVREEDLERLLRTMMEAQQRGVVVAAHNNTTSSNTNWDWYSSIFFATTVVTTIGYGNISPGTFGGQAFCVAFAVAGIPLCLIVLAELGVKMSSIANRLHARLKCACCTNQSLQKASRALMIILVGGTLMMIVPGVIFAHIEGWTYAEAFYYTFITLTTIGFGDFVAGVEPAHLRGLYRLCISCWIIIGLAWMSTVIAVYQENMEKVVEKAEKVGSKEQEESHAHYKEDEIESPVNGNGILNNNGLIYYNKDPQYSTQL